MNKLLRALAGKPHEDAFKFVEIAKQEIKLNKRGFFKVYKDDKNIFTRCLYISNVMVKYSEKFLDVVLGDSTGVLEILSNFHPTCPTKEIFPNQIFSGLAY